MWIYPLVFALALVAGFLFPRDRRALFLIGAAVSGFGLLAFFFLFGVVRFVDLAFLLAMTLSSAVVWALGVLTGATLRIKVQRRLH